MSSRCQGRALLSHLGWKSPFWHHRANETRIQRGGSTPKSLRIRSSSMWLWRNLGEHGRRLLLAGLWRTLLCFSAKACACLHASGGNLHAVCAVCWIHTFFSAAISYHFHSSQQVGTSRHMCMGPITCSEPVEVGNVLENCCHDVQRSQHRADDGPFCLKPCLGSRANHRWSAPQTRSGSRPRRPAPEKGTR